ncbi:hypothetical protein H8A97_25500 [Bradyrhizobium sp. Arg62]|uniref:hypothetical protein n=1 Tax=Bradyrhizobium brasilense TaxID=1419277 RepID=UPI001E553C50|nr:hypothetical protein [Bradyrhizobium brasilense]MCC8948373.1 hypothetical protein [Bradyrhizobium brasilense]
MELFQEIAARGMLPLPELFKRYEDGEFPPPLFVRLFLGQAAQQEADELGDGDLDRSRLLGLVEATEDWFQDKMREMRDADLLTARDLAPRPA